MNIKFLILTLVYLLNFINISFAANKVEEYYSCSGYTIKYPLPSAEEYCSMYKQNQNLYKPCLQKYAEIKADVAKGNCSKHSKTILREYTDECGALCKEYAFGTNGIGTNCSGGNSDCMKRKHQQQMQNRINDLKQRNIQK